MHGDEQRAVRRAAVVIDQLRRLAAIRQRFVQQPDLALRQRQVKQRVRSIRSQLQRRGAAGDRLLHHSRAAEDLAEVAVIQRLRRERDRPADQANPVGAVTVCAGQNPETVPRIGAFRIGREDLAEDRLRLRVPAGGVVRFATLHRLRDIHARGSGLMMTTSRWREGGVTRSSLIVPPRTFPSTTVCRGACSLKSASHSGGHAGSSAI